MKVTVTVENGGHEIEVSRTNGSALADDDLAELIDATVEDVRRGCRLPAESET